MPEIEKEIPVAEESEVVDIPKGTFGVIDEIKNKLDQVSGLIFAVVIAVVVSAMAALISVVGIFWDQIRFNNAAYKEYSEKIQTLDSIQKSNEALLQEVKNNQAVIINLEEQIKSLENE